ncbi:hypothetical protein [Streptomyces sp. 3213.3]|nr:hypothetical protein [Streptomyces sp. 3213.3]
MTSTDDAGSSTGGEGGRQGPWGRKDSGHWRRHRFGRTALVGS